MAGFIDSYDLGKAGQNYECQKQKLDAYPRHWKMQQSVWIIESTETHEQVRNKLIPCLDANDRLFVGKLSGAAWHGITEAGTRWLIDVIK